MGSLRNPFRIIFSLQSPGTYQNFKCCKTYTERQTVMQNVSTANKAKWYEIRRNELLELIEKTSSLQIQEKYAKELAEVKKKCLENQFEIVLIGEFQGGKSTTFNALCDGRDLSPRGLGGGGIKTSAAIISAQNISDGETCNGLEEWAEITFKSKYDIQSGMFQIAHEMLAADDEFRSSVMRKNGMSEDDFSSQMANPDTFAQLLDLDDPGHRRAIKKLLNSKWQEWKDNPASLDEATKDSLHIATLQERFYGTPAYSACISKNIRGIYEFQKLIAFPSDWAIKWTEGKNASFTFDEAAFVFIGRTLLRIKSANLAALGCRITDSPGLGANDYDTNVAKCAIIQSDAIWYLIGGEKQIGEKELESLNIIKSMGMDAKITGSVNLKGKQKQKLDQVFPVTQAKLKEGDFSFDLLPYNARLAFLAAQGKRIVENQSFSDYEINCMKIDADNDDDDVSLEEMWTEMVSDAGVYTGIKELKQVDSADTESVESVAQASCFNDIMTNLSEKIISQKSRSILIDNGSARAANALQEYEGILKMSEDAALQDEEEWKKKVAEAETTLNAFVGEAQTVITDFFPDYEIASLSSALALDLVKAIVENPYFVQKLSELIAQDQLDTWWKFRMDNKAYLEATKNRLIEHGKIFDLLKNICIKTTEGWKSGSQTADSWYRLQSLLCRAKDRIRKTWEEKKNNKEYLASISPNMPSGNVLNSKLSELQNKILNEKDLLNGVISFTSSKITKFNFCQGVKEFADGISNLGEASWNRIKNLFDPNLTGSKVDQQGKDLNSKKERQAAERQREFEEFVRTEVAPIVKKQFKDLNLQSELSHTFVGEFNKMQKETVSEIRQVLDDMLESFKNEHVDPAMRNFTLAESKRKEIAEENHRIRVEQIEPVRKEIRAFEQQVSLELQD